MTINYLGSISANDLPATFTKFFVEPVSVGFPSPANDYLESPIDLNQYLIKNGAATFLVRVSGDSMLDANIADQASLIVDRSLKPKHGSIVVASLDGDFVCKRLQLNRDCAYCQKIRNINPSTFSMVKISILWEQ